LGRSLWLGAPAGKFLFFIIVLSKLEEFFFVEPGFPKDFARSVNGRNAERTPTTKQKGPDAHTWKEKTCDGFEQALKQTQAAVACSFWIKKRDKLTQALALKSLGL
jgi:hypothetical protein